MQPYVRFLEAEPSKHSVIKFKPWIRISRHLKIVSAFNGTRHSRPYSRSDLRQIATHLFRTTCNIFIYSTTFAFCHGCVLPSPYYFVHSNESVSDLRG